VDGKELTCHARVSARARHVRGVVHHNGTVELVVPRRLRLSEADLHGLFAKHRAWFEKTVRRLKTRVRVPLVHPGEPAQIIARRTHDLVHVLLREVHALRSFSVREVRVRRYKTRWGCCMPGARLAFHYKLSLLPRPVAKYVVVHEVSHLFHPNHSSRFWQMVASLCP
jgi:predicted metal-dependent hydrolase